MDATEILACEIQTQQHVLQHKKGKTPKKKGSNYNQMTKYTQYPKYHQDLNITSINNEVHKMENFLRRPTIFGHSQLNPY